MTMKFDHAELATIYKWANDALAKMNEKIIPGKTAPSFTQNVAAAIVAKTLVMMAEVGGGSVADVLKQLQDDI